MNSVPLSWIPEKVVLRKRSGIDTVVNLKDRLLEFLNGSCCPVDGVWKWDLESWLDFEKVPEITDIVHKIIEKNENPKTRLRFNTVLFTKNGTRIGNGIIVNIYHSKSLKKIFYTVKTDYGNSVSMSEDQIRDNFHVGKRSNKGHKHYIRKKERHKLAHIEK